MSCFWQAGVDHLDTKPANVLIMDDDFSKVKLIDFNITKSRSCNLQLMQASSLVSTLAYMAPELVKGRKNVGRGKPDY
ncbi:hypothetical protein COT42_01050 [Candidatus Saganbacteria bacterium CG08_land_8_20_14_0_20_45_16]|uniref:Protein kinase domain-containing protein n=1 Tax=Candidatus Saganbacteria bacterium CG08_land_8_20_14_0_20_45_16 TaxID=2014293 RepID=A0A2H0Y3M9_UNCSA|nr:MAG: hypothetical protein COT42_01050 [Candidatus Saganbacteria bacterium CG08_land_8_20_14_0_20_45_16]